MNNLCKIIFLCVLIFSGASSAEVNCLGTINQVYKWSDKETISILLSGTTRWIRMPTKSDESLALLAFASGKPVRIYWSATDVTSCSDGWSNNRVLQGYFLVQR